MRKGHQASRVSRILTSHQIKKLNACPKASLICEKKKNWKNFQQTEHEDAANTSVRLCSCTKPRVCINSCTGTTSSLSKQREFSKSICSPPLMPSSLEQSGPGARFGLRSALGNKLTRRRLRMTLDYFSQILRMSREPPSYPCLGGGGRGGVSKVYSRKDPT